jgi:hypothetical protein
MSTRARVAQQQGLVGNAQACWPSLEAGSRPQGDRRRQGKLDQVQAELDNAQINSNG